MDPKKTIELRTLLVELIKTIPDEDADTLLGATERLERWVDNYASEQASIAIQPFLKFNVKNIK